MSGLDPALRAAIVRALPHVDDPRTDTQSVVTYPSPDGSRLVVLFDAWEFHMGATTEKIALVDGDARVLRVFPFECVNTGTHACAWREDGAMFALAAGHVFVWSLADQRFALAGIDFTASSIAFDGGGIRVRESRYRVGKGGYGYYADGPAGARFRPDDLAWHEASALERYEELAMATVRVKAGKIG